MWMCLCEGGCAPRSIVSTDVPHSPWRDEFYLCIMAHTQVPHVTAPVPVQELELQRALQDRFVESMRQSRKK